MPKKLSAILIELAELALKNPEGLPAPGAADAALVLATAAWNREVRGADWAPPESYLPLLGEFEEMYPDLWTSLITRDCEALIDELRAYKRRHYSGDGRFVRACGINERGNVEVHSEPG